MFGEGILEELILGTVKRAFQEKSINNPDLEHKLYYAFGQASSRFFDKYQNQFDSPAGTFLALSENLDKFVKSFFLSAKKLTPADVNSVGPNGKATPPEAIQDFCNFLEEEAKKIRDLDAIIAQKDHFEEMHQQTETITDIHNLLKSFMSNQTDTSQLVQNLSLSLSKFVEKEALNIRNVMRLGKINMAESELEKLMCTESFANLSKGTKVELYFLKGQIALRIDRMDTVEQCAIEIKRLDEQSPKSDELNALLAIERVNEEALKHHLTMMQIKGVPQSDIDTLLASIYIVRQNDNAIISLLSTDGVIRSDLCKSPRARIYLGLAFLRKGNYSEAEQQFVEAYRLEPVPYTNFLLLTSQIDAIVNIPGKAYFLNETDKYFLRKLYDELKSLTTYFDEHPITGQVDYYVHCLAALTFIEPLDAIREFESFSPEIKKNDYIQLALANAYHLANFYDKAQSIFEVVYPKTKDPEILIKLLFSMFLQQNYTNILEYVEDISYEKFDKRGIVAGIVAECYDLTRDYSATKELIKQLTTHFSDSTLLFEKAAEIAYKNEDTEWSQQLIQKAVALITKDDDLVRLSVGLTCRDIGLLDLGIEVLTPLRKYLKKAEFYLIQMLLESEHDDHKSFLYSIVNEAIDAGTNEASLYQLRAQLKYKDGNLDDTITDYEKAYILSPDEPTLYNTVSLKLGSKKTANIDKYLPDLLKSSDPKLISLAAKVNHALNRGGSSQLGYKSLHLLGEAFDELVYLDFLWLHLPDAKTDVRRIDYDKVEPDTVVTLVSDLDSKDRKVVIDSDATLIKIEGEVSLACEHFTTGNIIALQLLDQVKGNIVKIDGVSFTITEIIDKHVYAFRYVMNRYTMERPDSPHLTAISVSSDDPITPILPILERLRQADNFLFRQYNSELGIPLTAFKRGQLEMYLGTIIKLFKQENQYFYAGELNDFDLTISPVVLTLSSISVLNILGGLNLIKNIPNIIIPKALIDTVQEIFEQERTSQATLSAGLGNDGQLQVYQRTEEENTAIINFWRDILTELRVHTIIDEIKPLPGKKVRTDLVAKFDFDAISLANEYNGILLCDDRFIKRLGNLFFSELKQTNVASVINAFANLEQRLNMLVSLTSYNYVFACSLNSLLNLAEELIKTQLIIGDGTRYSKFSNLIRNLCEKELFKIYLPTLRNLLHHLLSKNLILATTEQVVIIILTEIRNATLKLNLPQEELLRYLLAPYKYDLMRGKYLKDLFEHVNSTISIP